MSAASNVGKRPSADTEAASANRNVRRRTSARWLYDICSRVKSPLSTLRFSLEVLSTIANNVQDEEKMHANLFDLFGERDTSIEALREVIVRADDIRFVGEGELIKLAGLEGHVSSAVLASSASATESAASAQRDHLHQLRAESYDATNLAVARHTDMDALDALGGNTYARGSLAASQARDAGALIESDDDFTRSTRPRGNGKEKGEANAKTAEPPAMEKGKALQRPQGFDAVDMFYPRLQATDRTLVLQNLTAALGYGISETSVDAWRVQFEKSCRKSTLWALARGLAEGVHDLLDKKVLAQKENKPAHNNNASMESKSDATTDLSEKKPTASIGPLSGNVLDSLEAWFLAYLDKDRHKAMLEAIQPTDVQTSLTCDICRDHFDAGDTVACSGADLHFYCKPCLASYCTVTVTGRAVQSMECPMPDCKSLFATHDVKSILSEWDILTIERREEARDRRVALAAKAMLHCECGMVAVVTKEDMGDGRIACPGEGCGQRYCAKCGNEDHGKETCPPPAETMQWLNDNSKECPNCKQRVEKNGGCDHMTCAPPGGCGHEWWWSCGCDFRGAHKCGQ